MSNLIVSITLAVLALQFFTVTYRVNGINRTLYNIPIAIFESSIPLAQETEEPEIYYDADILEEKLTSYFDKSITKYCDKYEVEIYYYNQDDFSYCSSGKCDAVELTLTADLFIGFNYSRTARFYIQDNR